MNQEQTDMPSEEANTGSSDTENEVEVKLVLPIDLADRIQEVAAKANTSMSTVINVYLASFLVQEHSDTGTDTGTTETEG